MTATLGTANAAERYAATVEDGTPKSIQANTALEDESQGNETITEEHVTRKVVRTPRKTLPKTRLADKPRTTRNELQDLRRQNNELKRRLEIIERERVEQQAESAGEESADAADVAEQEPRAGMDATSNGGEALSEGVGAVEPASAPPVVAPKAGKARVSAVQKTVTPAATGTDPAVAATMAPAAKPSKYDVVPDKHIPDIAQRLKYTNEILKRFGRAYDYRATTLTEFRKILAELEKAK